MGTEQMPADTRTQYRQQVLPLLLETPLTEKTG